MLEAEECLEIGGSWLSEETVALSFDIDLDLDCCNAVMALAASLAASRQTHGESSEQNPHSSSGDWKSLSISFSSNTVVKSIILDCESLDVIAVVLIVVSLSSINLFLNFLNLATGLLNLFFENLAV
ncbi:hypothetical protein WICPIJ_002646 [Wickerhamomyces pijperi]|uniref:Uncharacterized protein n=1 Tax=Wickerhamomyces pijperi TaxID=599730 RepID=A0A9P8Q8T3_WICPI|nr:hypothetical protein WICPIJ_002646 [Wickerhamomyces pijperi]